MKHYSQMKDSGIEWIGEIPEEWDVKQLKRDTPILRGASPRPIDDPKYFDERGEYGWVRISDVTASDTFLETTQQKLSVLGSNLSVKLFPKDLFLSIAGSVGKPCITAIPCCIHDGFVYFPRLSMNQKFLFYIFKIGLCFQGLGKLGTQLNLNTETVGSIGIPFPTTNEQKQIALFLDKKTKIIDDEITKNQNLIKLLQEKKQSVINHVVTKGLDDTVPMKDSGIESIGEIPEEWTTIKLKNITDFIKDGTHNPPPRIEKGKLLLSSEHISKGFLDYKYRPAFISENDFQELQKYCKIKRFDILLTIIGANIGKSISVNSDIDFHVQRSLAILRPSKNILSKYLHYLIQSNFFQKFLLTNTNTSAQGGIYLNSLKNIPIVFTLNDEEQKQIVSFLDKKTTKIDSLISKIQLQISKLQEFRESLISSAVTGKICVTN